MDHTARTRPVGLRSSFFRYNSTPSNFAVFLVVSGRSHLYFELFSSNSPAKDQKLCTCNFTSTHRSCRDMQDNECHLSQPASKKAPKHLDPDSGQTLNDGGQRNGFAPVSLPHPCENPTAPKTPPIAGRAACSLYICSLFPRCS